MSQHEYRENVFAHNLKRLIEEGATGAFLIVEADTDIFIQFSKTTPGSMQWECVSNEYLPAHRQLTEEAVEQMQRHGFIAPPGESPNFVRFVDEPIDEGVIMEIAQTSCEVLDRIYGCPPQAELTIQLELQV